MDFQKLRFQLRQEQKEKGGGSPGGSPGGSNSETPLPEFGPRVKRHGLVVRGCKKTEVLLWQTRGDQIQGQLPSSNDFTSGTGYALEIMGIYNSGWKGKLLESIRVCKKGSCQTLVILKNNNSFGIEDYNTTLNKTPIFNSAVMVAWVDLESMSAEDATEEVCRIIMDLTL